MASTPDATPEPSRRSPSTALKHLLHDTFSARLLLSAILSISLAWCLLAFDLWHTHSRRMENAHNQAASLTLAVEHRVVRTLRLSDQALRLARDEIDNQRAWKDAATLTRILARLAPGLDEILTLSFIAPDGVSLAQSNAGIPTGLNYSASDFFRFHLGSHDDTFYVEKPIVGPASGQRVFTVSRRLVGPRGELLGIVSASLRTDVLAAEFESIRIGENGSVGFHHLPSYRIIARQPEYIETFGRDLEHRSLLDAVNAAPNGFFEGIISGDDEKRFFAYRKLDDLPLAVTAGVAKADITAGLISDLGGYLAMALALSLAIAGGAALVLRAHRRELELQEVLTRKEAMFRAFFDAAPVGMCTLDQDMRYRLVNPAFARINASRTEDYVGRTVAEAQPALLRKITPIYEEVLATGRHFDAVEFHGEIPTRPGQHGYWLGSFFPILDGRQKPDGMGCIIVEVTERKEAENALRRWQQIFQHADWGIVTGSADGKTLELMNPAFARMHGYSPEELIGQPITSVFAPEVRDQLPGHIARSHEHGHYRYESLHLHRDGHVFPVLVDTTTVRGDKGEVLYRISNIQDMTEQKRAELALRRSERLLSTVLDTLPVGVFIAAPDGRIVRTNPAAEKIWMGSRFVGPEHYGDYKGWWAESGKPVLAEDWALARAIRNGEDSIGELIEIECFDGTHKTILNSAVTLHDPEAGPLGAIVVNEDITEFRRTQEEMRIARDFFEHTFNSAPVGMAIADIDGRYTKVNRAMTEFIGYPEEALLSMTYMDITHPDDVALNVNLRHDLLSGTCGSIQMEKRYVRQDGRIVWALMVGSIVRGKDGRPLYTIGQMLDIDRQKAAEQALRSSEERFRAIFDNANTGIGATDDQGFVIYFNEALRAMLGYDADVLKRMNFADFTHPDDLGRETRFIAEIKSGSREHYRMEKRYLCSDHSIVWVDIAASTIKDASGRIVNFVAVVNDISERKEAELALTRSRQKLRALSAHQALMLEEDRKHVAREIHDELGQLLTALKMDISLLRLKFGDNPQLGERIEKMRALVEQTIDVVRHVATNLRPSALDLGLLPAIEWLADDFSARWEIPCTVDADGAEITLNEMMSTTVFRVVQESLTNIARHAQASEVGITLLRDHRQLQIIVRDNGQGFDMATVGKEKRFGLFGMRERVLAVGGNLSIDSAPGKGTTIAIALPIQTDLRP